MKRILCLSLLILLTSVAAFSDIARPENTPKPKPTPKFKMSNTTMTMTIKMDANANQAILRIPKAQLKYLAELEDQNTDGDNTAANAGSFSRTQTIVSGAFLSLALVFGGMWFVRSGKSATKAGKTLVILALVTAAGSAATLVYANAGPPPALRSISSKLFDKKAFQYWNRASGEIRVETSPGDTIDLIVPDPAEPAKPAAEE